MNYFPARLKNEIVNLPYVSWMRGGSNELIFASAIAVMIQFIDVLTYMYIDSSDVS